MPSTRQLLTSSSQSHDIICCDITPGERSSGPSSSYESLFSLANVCHPNISLTLLMARNKKPFKSHHEIKGCIIKMHTGKKKMHTVKEEVITIIISFSETFHSHWHCVMSQILCIFCSLLFMTKQLSHSGLPKASCGSGLLLPAALS